jgi:hypothetical protein
MRPSALQNHFHKTFGSAAIALCAAANPMQPVLAWQPEVTPEIGSEIDYLPAKQRKEGPVTHGTLVGGHAKIALRFNKESPWSVYAGGGETTSLQNPKSQEKGTIATPDGTIKYKVSTTSVIDIVTYIVGVSYDLSSFLSTELGFDAGVMETTNYTHQTVDHTNFRISELTAGFGVNALALGMRLTGSSEDETRAYPLSVRIDAGGSWGHGKSEDPTQSGTPTGHLSLKVSVGWAFGNSAPSP